MRIQDHVHSYSLGNSIHAFARRCQIGKEREKNILSSYRMRIHDQGSDLYSSRKSCISCFIEFPICSLHVVVLVVHTQIVCGSQIRGEQNCEILINHLFGLISKCQIDRKGKGTFSPPMKIHDPGSDLRNSSRKSFLFYFLPHQIFHVAVLVVHTRMVCVSHCRGQQEQGILINHIGKDKEQNVLKVKTLVIVYGTIARL